MLIPFGLSRADLGKLSARQRYGVCPAHPRAEVEADRGQKRSLDELVGPDAVLEHDRRKKARVLHVEEPMMDEQLETTVEPMLCFVLWIAQAYICFVLRSRGWYVIDTTLFWPSLLALLLPSLYAVDITAVAATLRLFFSA